MRRGRSRNEKQEGNVQLIISTQYDREDDYISTSQTVLFPVESY